jgi:hypothetical protein
MIMTTIANEALALGRALAEDIANAEVSREAYMGRMAETSIAHAFTVAQLDEGDGHLLITSALAERNRLTGKPITVSAPELSRFKTAAHPKVRGLVNDLLTEAQRLCDTDKLTDGKRRQQVAESMMAALKKDDVSTVETASVVVLTKYADKAAKAVDPASFDGLIKSIKGKVNSKAMKDAMTEDSLKAVLNAIEGLAAKPAETPVDVPNEGEAPFDLAAALSAVATSNAPAAAKDAAIAALMAKL